ncbi:hypothetical protein M406DRAFT_324655 [Cryphonectria parasitica EP155]|uniref:MICOS complex subunit MIC12 n=1 Tax=Cryphonectria parasitica (strain ATCC 38755 / EP155) TaxID=660469 RepID=A0A9P5CKG6_CRYP1|nr:uncharacterized protein M406DRAFT_324655 [Cryphonectria parasitica EP155]KAF3761147.1 hypothetical protein M406DRAFT_324655 [Cryphonectria parasitica EP155]
MGFTTGLTGGVTLVLGAAYLTLQAHQRTRQSQAETLRAQAYVLNSLSYIPASAPPPKTLAEELALLEHQQELLARAQQRRTERLGSDASFVQRAKDRWNAEIEGAVRWAADKDWVAAREDAEDAAGRVWARVTGGEPPSVARTAERAKGAVVDGAAAAQGTVQQAGVRTKEVVQAGAAEAKEAAGSIWERGFRRGKEVASKAKAAVGLAEEKIEKKVVQAASSVSDVESVLQQRYEGRHGKAALDKSVDEILADRYRPVEELDNSKLRERVERARG